MNPLVNAIWYQDMRILLNKVLNYTTVDFMPVPNQIILIGLHKHSGVIMQALQIHIYYLLDII